MSSSTEKKKGGLAGKAKARLRILKIILPQIPFIVQLMLFHILKRSESSKYLDLRTVLLVSVARRLIDAPKGKGLSVSKLQAMTMRDPGVKGRIWISRTVSTVPPETSIRDVLISAIENSKQDLVSSDAKCRVPDVVPVEAEWTGHRENATRESQLPAISEEEKYGEMMKEVKGPVTVLYLHGGAYYLCDPSTHRLACKKLAKLTGGRVYNVRYRLAPQNPYPAALLDALVSYFTLLYPPPGAVHEAVAPSSIVFAGDSAGGNLSLGLLQTLLQFRRQNLKITWFGLEREVPLPAGVTAISPWLDLAQSLPSWTANQKWDYLPPPEKGVDIHPACPLWPTNPPRRHIVVEDYYLLHPLASLHLAHSWEGSPPVYISCGWECLADEDKYLAKKLAADGVPVVFEEYEAMPHVFGFLLTRRPESRRFFDRISGFMKAIVEESNKINSSFTAIRARTLKEVDLDVEKLSPYARNELVRLAYGRLVTDSVPNTPMSAKL